MVLGPLCERVTGVKIPTVTVETRDTRHMIDTVG